MGVDWSSKTVSAATRGYHPLLVSASLCFDVGDRASPTSLFRVRSLTPSAFGRNNHNTEVCAAGLAVAAAKEGEEGRQPSCLNVKLSGSRRLRAREPRRIGLGGRTIRERE